MRACLIVLANGIDQAAEPAPISRTRLILRLDAGAMLLTAAAAAVKLVGKIAGTNWAKNDWASSPELSRRTGLPSRTTFASIDQGTASIFPTDTALPM